MNKYLYDINLQDILREINLTDLYKIMNTKELRNLVFSSYNIKELVLSNIDDLEKKMDTNLFYELLGEYFEPKGYREDLIKEQEVYQAVMEEFYDKLFEFEEFDDEVVSELQNMKEENVDFYKIKDFLSDWIKSYSELKQLFNDTETKLDYIQNEFIKAFKNYLFNGPNVYQNLKEYLNVVEQYVDEYVDNEDLRNEFLQTVKKIGLLGSMMPNKRNSKRNPVGTMR